MSIRRLGHWVCGLIAVAAIGLGGLVVWVEAMERESALARSESVRAISKLRAVVIELSLERSVTQVSLWAEAPIATNFRSLIESQRSKADTGFAELRRSLESARRLPGKADFLRELDAELAALRTLRAEADRVLSVPKTQRAPERIDGLPIELKTRIGRLEGITVLLDSRRDVTESLSRVQALAWELREFGGRERTFLAIAAMRREGIGPAAVRETEVHARRAEQAFVRLIDYGRRDDLPEPVVQALAAMEESYSGPYAALREKAKTIALGGTTDLTFEDFFTGSSEALGLVEKVAAVAGDAAAAGLEEQTNVATFRLAAGIFAFVSSAAAVTFLFWFIERRVSTRIVGMTGLMRRLAEGDLAVDGGAFRGRDEVGDMADALDVFRANAAEAVRLRREQDELREQAAAEQKHVLRKLSEAVNDAVRDGLARIVQQVAALTSGLGDRTGDDAHAVERTLRAAADTAAAASRLEASFASITERATVSTDLARNAKLAGSRAEATIRALTEQIGSIRSFTETIESIAGQTSMLALNATIEAARAGEAGRGFAVVAAEIKQLSMQTARSTEAIREQVTTIVAATDPAVESVSAMASEIARIEAAGVAIADTVGAESVTVSAINAGASASKSSAELVRATVAAVAEEVDRLRVALTAALRNATPELNTRRSPRQFLSLRGAIDLAGRRHEVRVIDISEHGVAVDGILGAAVDAKGVIRLGHIERAVHVVGVDGAIVRLSFEYPLEHDELADLARAQPAAA